ncbi:hypothetical protein SLE2022_097760 [Rubroshorea leprosula]
MASSLPSFSSLTPLFNRRNLLTRYPKLRSQSFKGDEGKSADIVDASLSILRERIEEVKKKERISMSDTSRFLEHRWNYTSGYDGRYRHKRSNILYDSFQIVGFASYLLGLVFLSGSLGIYLVSFLVHLNKMN